MSSSITIQPTEHQVPPGAEVRHPTLCCNCTRRLYTKVGKLTFCVNCSQMAESFAQVWACLACKLERKWGEGFPEDKQPKLLNCARCTEPTEHSFSYVA